MYDSTLTRGRSTVKDDVKNVTKRTVSYSRSENRMLEILQRQKRPITTIDMIDLFYKGRIQPLNARSSVYGIARSLQNKVDINKERFRIALSENRGPHPSEIQIERR